MKVAILTWFHYHNYGTALQVYALCKTLEKLGYKADVVRYIPYNQDTSHLSDGLLAYYAGKISRRLSAFGSRPVSEEATHSLFSDFLRDNLTFTPRCETFSDFRELNNTYDAFICGSDQIWAPSRYNPRYFLDFVECPERMIAYAPSVGLNQIKNPDIADEIQRLSSRFTWISTRERSGSALIADLIGRKVETVIDPTLLLEEQEWCSEDNQSESPYLLAYFLGRNERQWAKVYETAATQHLQVKVIPIFTKDLKRSGCLQTPVGPNEFLRLLKNTAFICTDSFHGTAFAINFRKQFLSFERFKANEPCNQNSRIYNLLELTGLRHRLYSPKEGFAAYGTSIDYGEVCQHLQQAREHSLNFLGSALKHIEAHAPTPKSRIGKENSICCGCAACSMSCPVNAISMEERDGFKTAVVNEDKCISCGKCANVCPLFGTLQSKTVAESELYSYKDAAAEVLETSSSGGAAYRIAQHYSEKGYAIIGCIFDAEEQRARHILIRPEEADKLPLLKGSKYTPSDFSGVVNELKYGTSPLVVFGTPCQIAGARKIASAKREIIYVDLICHGVPSKLAYDKYRTYLNVRHGMKTEHLRISFRHKKMGWRERYIYSTDGKKQYCAHQDKDPYFRIFESCFAFARSCYECRFRASSVADIRVGDYWHNKFAQDTTGVSMVISFTEKGKEIVPLLKETGSLQMQDASDYFECQQSTNAPQPVFYKRLTASLNNNLSSLEQIADKYVLPFERRRKIYRVLRYLKKIITRRG